MQLTDDGDDDDDDACWEWRGNVGICEFLQKCPETFDNKKHGYHRMFCLERKTDCCSSHLWRSEGRIKLIIRYHLLVVQS